MARPLRLQVANGVYHVTARGNERGVIYRDDRDRRSFLELLTRVRERHRWRILAYCLMGNHYHLLVQIHEPDLASGMRDLNGIYAQTFNRRHARVGHLMQGRYGARLVQEDEHLLPVVRYIVRNPVRAGFCTSPSAWAWSSQRALLGQAPAWFLDTEALLSHYGRTREAARARYREHTEDEGPDVEPLHPLVEGDGAFVARALDGLETLPGIPRRYLERSRPDLGALLRSADPDALAAAHAHGYSLREIARQLGVNASTVSRRLGRFAGAQAATERT